MTHVSSVKQTNLNSNVGNIAKYTSALTTNSWGIVKINNDIWVANNGSNTLVKYNHDGNVVQSITTTNSPTGLVKNNSNYFGGYNLMTAGEIGGTIEGFKTASNLTTTTVILTVPNAILKGLAVSYNKLYVVNFADQVDGGGNVIIYDLNFNFVKTFTDPDLIASGYYPFNVAIIENYVYVTFAKKNGNDDESGIGNGYVDIFTLDGIFIKRLINRGHLNSPWGMIYKHKKLYVGNFGDGKINIYDTKSGNLLTALQDMHNNDIIIDHLWGLFDDGKKIFFAAGINDEEDGLIGKLTNTCPKKCASSD